MLAFRPSAARHGISRARAAYVVANCLCPLYAPGADPDDADPDDADVLVFLGPDANGVPLEVVGIEMATGDLIVIHAMRLRRKYAKDYARVMRCR